MEGSYFPKLHARGAEVMYKQNTAATAALGSECILLPVTSAGKISTLTIFTAEVAGQRSITEERILKNEFLEDLRG